MWLFAVGCVLAMTVIIGSMIYMSGVGTVGSLFLGAVMSMAIMIIMVGILLSINIDPLHIQLMSQSACTGMDP